jgi:serine acetyltransferase
MKLLDAVVRDTLAIARTHNRGQAGFHEVTSTLVHDGTQALILSRLRDAARRSHIPLAGAALRRAQTALFGMEISRDVELGEGVVFLHTVGIVIGGDTKVGDRVIFLGSNTLGSIGKKGYPRIGNDVVIGCGARILGPITIGDGAAIGANAVVLTDVPPGAVAVGIPAVIREGVPSPNR